MAEALTINWHPTLKDAYYSLRLGFWGTPARSLRSVILLFVVPAVLFGTLLNFAMHPSLSLGATVLAGIAFGLAWGVLFAFAFGAWLARFVVKTQRAKGDPQRIVVTHEAVERILSESRITHPWSAISRIEETPLAFLLCGPSGPIAGIEKSGITSDAELRTLRSFLRAKKPGMYLDDERT
jgi:hypothetical protein